MDPTSFAELNLSAKVLAAIEAAGYATPTPIQAQAIPVAVTGRDVLGIAQTGTGKTASFVLPMITRLESGRARARMPRSLILAPTRELAAQVAQSFEKYGVNHKLDVALLIGGVSMDDQVRKLDRGVDVLIATPGRLLDHFQRGRVMLIGVEILVIDEADRMLDMGFIPDIEKICKLLPPRRQTLFFSATMPPEITRLVATFLKDPVRIEVAKPATTAKTITQRFRFCDSSEDWEKREVLRELLRMPDVRNAIIFCNRKRDVAILLKSLQKHGFNAGALHGDMDQSSRMATLDAFRDGRIQLLAASDVAARGLDIPDVSHVFNYDIPWQPDDYVHRIGRTGRAGRQGFAASIVTPEDFKSLGAISKLIGEEPAWLGEAPDEATIAEGMSRRGRGRRGAAPKGRGRDAGGGRRRSEAPRRDRDGDEQRAPRQESREQRAQRSGSETARRERGPREGAEMRERPERSSAAPSGERGRQEARQPARRPERTAERGSDQPRDREQPRERSRPQPEREEARGPSRRQHEAREDRRDRPTPQPQRRRNEESGAQRRGGGGNEQSPVGMGEHVPAFLRRPVRAVERS